MLLREATLADVAGLVDVQQAGAQLALAHIFPQSQHPFPRAAISARWAAEVASPDVDVLVVGRDPIEAFAAMRSDELLHFGTAVSTWGTGLAGEVHAELIERFVAAGHPSAWLRVFEQNHRARRFYEKMGWSATERRSRSPFAPHPVLVEYRIGL
ncbi:GNAT family N-acetyltransferase [Asanoa sp. WMMD1127]|uniref:GNAT family N-acetyltransferase n=1 Tax=Asanoa sp. WMMD1127 TaxID=3016107 RepID=UPI002415EC32|nr:GNAT family N-acetyltransferase [Asanoa sp. WMMD1127]MDG4822885.1 GNAT family N-acetyltransferase [Asanoa sp. WMMD1127]